MIITETTRLTIRTWEKEDLPAAIKLWGDPEVTKFISKSALTNDQVKEKLAQELKYQKDYNMQYWAVGLKETYQIIGCCGMHPYNIGDRTIYEVGFHFMKTQWGKGYASEAAKAVIQYAFNTMKMPALFAGHHPDNKASKHLLEKLGFKYIRDDFFAPTGLMHPSYKLTAPTPELKHNNSQKQERRSAQP